MAETRSFMFLPWVFLLTVSVSGKLAGLKGYMIGASLVTALYFSQINLYSLTLSIVFNSKVLPYFCYMFITLLIALPLLYKYANNFDKCTVRKLFHLLAIVLFMPCLIQQHRSKEIQRFIIFAFNSITAVLVMIEQARSQLQIH